MLYHRAVIAGSTLTNWQESCCYFQPEAYHGTISTILQHFSTALEVLALLSAEGSSGPNERRLECLVSVPITIQYMSNQEERGWRLVSIVD